MDSETINRLHKKSVIKSIFPVVTTWTVIVGVSYLAYVGQNTLGYVIAGIIIASRQHALLVIMHEACHYSFLKNRKLADFICNFFCAYPIGMSVNRYRVEHDRHHRKLLTQEDPNWVRMNQLNNWTLPKTKKELVLIFIKDLLGTTMSEHIFILKPWSWWNNPFTSQTRDGVPPLSRQDKLTLVASLIAIGGLFLTLPLMSLVPWFMGMAFLNPLTRMRAISEHPFIEAPGVSKKITAAMSFNVKSNFVGRFFFAPYNINYHSEHHLYPLVPQYNLPKLRKHLLGNEEFKNNHPQFSGYLFGKNSTFNYITTPAPELEQSQHKAA